MNNPTEPVKISDQSHSSETLIREPDYVFSYQRWLENFLKVILRVSVGVGFALILASFLTNTEPILLVIYVVAYVGLLIAAFLPVPYRIRAYLFLFLLFSLGVSSLLENGINSDSRTFFPVFIIMATMLFGRRASLYAFILTILAGILIGVPILTGHLKLISAGVNPGTWDAWIMGYLVNSLLALLITTGLRMLQEEFDRAQQDANNSMHLLTEQRNMLDIRVQERTSEFFLASEDAKNRTNQLKVISELATTIAQIQDINELLPAVTRLISQYLGFYHAGVFLLDEKKEFAVLMAANSAGGQRMLQRGHKLRVGQVGIVGYVAEKGEPRISLDVGTDAVFFDNPDLPGTHSELALPLIITNQLIGVLDVQSEKVSAFSREDIDVMSTLANQVAIAIENARRFSETRQALAEARTVYSQYLHQAWQQSPLDKNAIGYHYSNAMTKPMTNPLDSPDIDSAIMNGKIVLNSGINSNMVIPLKLRDEIIGVLNISSQTPSRQWNENEISLVKAVADRVALALENARLFEETTHRADRERTVSEITTHIRSSSDPQQMLQAALDDLKKALGASGIQIRPYNPSQFTEPAKDERNSAVGTTEIDPAN